MSSEFAIKVENLSKCYPVYNQPRDRLKQFVLPRLQRMVGIPPKQYYREFWALKDVSFEVKKGETIGIVGRNGSGKSTLLQLICGTLAPTSGHIKVNGRIAALLELGSGFNPEFTGKENVYLYGSVMGLTREEIDARFDDIVAFADIGDFIEQPVKVYSSGMVVRLAFAVIAHVDADVLVIDEALAVGDAFFQQKCMRFLRNFHDRCGTLFFVSHDMSAVTGLCERAILLTRGTVSCIGSAQSISKLYLEQLYSDYTKQHSYELLASENKSSRRYADINNNRDGKTVFEGDTRQETLYQVSGFRSNSDSFGHRGAIIRNAGFLDEHGQTITSIKGGQRVSLFIQVDVHKVIRWPAFGFMIKNNLGEFLFTEGTDLHFRQYKLVFHEGEVATALFTFTMPHLNRGKYFINVAFAEGLGDEHIQHCWIHDAIQLDVISSRLAHGYCGMNDIAMTIEVGSQKLG